MILTGSEIEKQIGLDNIKINPFNPSHLGPNSYDVTLAPELMQYHPIQEIRGKKVNYLDSKHDNRTISQSIPEKGLILLPGTLYLGRTVEHTETKNYVPMLEGRSSTGRLGISIHATAGFGDIGFKGYWTLEITVVQPIRIYSGMRIGQIYYLKPEGNIQTTYSSKYQDNHGIQSSQLWRDYETHKDILEESYEKFNRWG